MLLKQALMLNTLNLKRLWVLSLNLLVLCVMSLLLVPKSVRLFRPERRLPISVKLLHLLCFSSIFLNSFFLEDVSLASSLVMPTTFAAVSGAGLHSLPAQPSLDLYCKSDSIFMKCVYLFIFILLTIINPKYLYIWKKMSTFALETNKQVKH